MKVIFSKSGTAERVGIGLGLVLLAIGCGGGGTPGSSNPNNSGNAVPATYGSVTAYALGGAQPPAISSSHGATVYGLAGASFTQVAQIGGSAGTVVPAANKIAFVHNDQIAIMDANGANVTILTPNITRTIDPRISSDGRKVAFGYNGDIYQVNVDGTGFAPLVTSASQLSWSRDGKKIAFVRRAQNGYDNIFTANVDGTNLVQVTNLNADHNTPEWSPDNTKIAFNRNSQVFTCNPDGSNVVQLTIGGPYGECPAWSPDGKKISFYDGGDMWTMNADGTSKIRIMNGWNFDRSHLAYSADGLSLIFSARQGNTYDIFSVKTSGLSAVNLTPASSALDDLDPSASPVSTSTTTTTPVSTTYVGIGGSFTTACGGFLFGQIDRTVTSFVTFDTALTTPAGRLVTRVTPLSAGETNSQNLVFTISTTDDSLLKSLKYSNGTGPVNVAIPSGPIVGASGIVVTFSANDGGVSTILPFNVTKGSDSQPKLTRDGSTLHLGGRFLGVFDKDGHKTTGTVSQVDVDAQTGRIIAIR